MARLLMVCGLVMGGLVGAVNWLEPGSVILWFAAADGQLATLRWSAVAVLAVLLVADAYADYAIVRRLSAASGGLMVYEAGRILSEHSVYVLDFLLVLLAAVCCGLVALQPEGEQRQLPSAPGMRLKRLRLKAS